MPKAVSSTKTELLAAFWNRHTFHDMAIESITAVNRRLVIRLTEFTLIVTEVKQFHHDKHLLADLPVAWLYETMTGKGQSCSLEVETEAGRFSITGKDIRLIRNRDMAILIPPVDN